MAIDVQAIEEHIRGILIALGDDPEREGLKDTPKRVAKMYEDIYKGMCYTNDEIAGMLNTTFEDDMALGNAENDLVFMKDIEIFSHCEHHLALMYNMKVAVAYPQAESHRLEQNSPDRRYGGTKAATAGKNRQRHRGNPTEDHRIGGRSRHHPRRARLHDHPRHPEARRENHHDYAARTLQH